MTSMKGARRVASLLRSAAAEESDPGPEPAAREAAIAAVGVALAARRRARQARRAQRVAVVFAAAAGLLFIVGFAISRRVGQGDGLVAVVGHGAGAGIRRSDGSAVLGTSVPLEVGSRVETPVGGSVHLTFASGTELDLHAAGAVEVGETGSTQSFLLSRGALDAHVAKLSAGHRFLVRTPDAEVEVRGTRFRVTVGGAACGGRVGVTRVDVEEGVVVVRAGGTEARVAGGESWPRCEAPPTAVTTVVPTSAAVTAAAPLVAASSSLPPSPVLPAAPTPPPAEPPSSLGSQNALYERALEQKRAGATSEAIASFDQLLTRYPGGPLAESAAAERLRLLAKQGSPRTGAAAREYLRRYPQGFARATAEELAGPGAP